MMHRGYTIRWRKRWDKGYHKDHLLWVMMDWFIDHANYEDNETYLPNYGTVKLERGQHIFGIPSMARYFNVSEKRIRTRLKILEKTEFLAIKRTNRFSIATITNYSRYQDNENRKGKQKGGQGASKGQAEGKQGATHNTLRIHSEDIIKHLNNISGRNFGVKTNIDYVIPRLKEGHTKEECEKVIETKWKDPDFNKKYFRPSTLFKKSKFEGYINESVGISKSEGRAW